MSSTIIELSSRVFEIETVPDTPGFMRRTVTLYQLSGPPMAAAELAHVIDSVKALLRDMGVESFHMEIWE